MAARIQIILLNCVMSRKGCESTARHVAKFLKLPSVGSSDVSSEFSDAAAAIEALRRCPAGLDPILGETLPFGVAYHHAGLTVEEREIVESCYRKGLVRVLTATSTLAAGVNLPARRFIFRQPKIGRDFIDGTHYRQMAGRAGRTGIDTKGESILVWRLEEVKRITGIIRSNCPPSESCLSEDKNGMTHAIMEVVLDDLSRAREGFVLASDLHFVYLVTLINVGLEPDWELYYERFMLASLEQVQRYDKMQMPTAAMRGAIVEAMARSQSVGNWVGVIEPLLILMAHGASMPVCGSPQRNTGLSNKSAQAGGNALVSEHTLRVSKRFYVALMLSRLAQV
ncbi:unnamed protein product [Miscanthus lutarioriparius]|uniref:Helicase C-terminal domain-containing protein n=1 Tax=Miscanthus lutarioriparius TaxID=422564 RepID=A0A811SDM5_9POAL|nr:unnamed protein product [Miscanthus lutarioriparius]